MANIYVRSTDGSDSDNGSTWALAKATLAGAIAAASAGDTIWLSQSHSESTAGNVALTIPGTLASPVRVLCGNDAAEPPTALATTAVVSCTGTTNITINGVAYLYGVTFNGGSGSGAAEYLQVAQTDGSFLEFEDCNLNVVGTHAAGRVSIGIATSVTERTVTFKNTWVRFGAAAQAVRVTQCRLIWNGGGLAAGGTSPTNLIELGTDGQEIRVSGIDVSAGENAIRLFLAGANGCGTAIIRNSRLPSAWNGILSTLPTANNVRIEAYNVGPSYRLWTDEYAGSIFWSTAVFRAGGANDGTTPLSWVMLSSANTEYPLITLDSPEVVVWNDAIGSSITLEVEVLTDGVTLKDTDCWVEVQYLGTSGVLLGSFVNDAAASVLATPANQSSSSASWTTPGLSSPVTQKLSVTFTPQERGFVHAVVKLAKSNEVVYVCPKLTVV